MAIQPTLFALNTHALTAFLAKQGGIHAIDCPRLTDNGTLTDEACWETFVLEMGCCPVCVPGNERPLRVPHADVQRPILTREQPVPKRLYLWAQTRWDDELSWVRDTDLDEQHWRLWALLTHRTVHLTTDKDRTGLCGFLTADELRAFVQPFHTLRPPDENPGNTTLDMAGSEDDFRALQVLLRYSEHCVNQGTGLAWVHDFLL